ncbi:Concanavalin A-like lectin/glucanases superfamily [Pseudocohnilembus persalinus]|uniref:Concanavalin A-like lectin/glucanases superfamily n=1 Tax=Pseudocohnilembus persalinus TaxID=266149 RepID=A0A0V0QY45_PSEPJ|nr:Concanavalin A-like lectin/glucanases superfamily [Pseudocohnilembus persalinus]|eukprot:KRX07021.1 Concanavalin A-like lectin/glucanases superfamily [Pseudocohnilembus persalinus]
MSNKISDSNSSLSLLSNAKIIIIITLMFLLQLQFSKQALVLDGTSNIYLSDSTILNTSTDDFTLEIWIKNFANQGAIFSVYDQNKDEWDKGAKVLYIYDENLYFSVFKSSSENEDDSEGFLSNPCQDRIYSSLTPYNTNEWLQITITMQIDTPSNDFHTVKLYFNGNQVAQKELDSKLDDKPDHAIFKLGSMSSDYAGFNFDGQVSNIALWNTLLTNTQIQENTIRAPGSLSDMNLLGVWLVKEGSSVTIFENQDQYNLISADFISSNNLQWTDAQSQVPGFSSTTIRSNCLYLPSFNQIDLTGQTSNSGVINGPMTSIAQYFNGIDQYTDFGGIYLNSQFTIKMNIRIDSCNNDVRIFDFYSSFQLGNNIFMGCINNDLILSIMVDHKINKITVSNSFIKGEWFNLIIGFGNNDSVDIYIDNALQTYTSIKEHNKSPESIYRDINWLARSTDDTSIYFHGAIDEFYLLNNVDPSFNDCFNDICSDVGCSICAHSRCLDVPNATQDSFGNCLPGYTKITSSSGAYEYCITCTEITFTAQISTEELLISLDQEVDVIDTNLQNKLNNDKYEKNICGLLFDTSSLALFGDSECKFDFDANNILEIRIKFGANHNIGVTQGIQWTLENSIKLPSCTSTFITILTQSNNILSTLFEEPTVEISYSTLIATCQELEVHLGNIQGVYNTLYNLNYQFTIGDNLTTLNNDLQYVNDDKLTYFKFESNYFTSNQVYQIKVTLENTYLVASIYYIDFTTTDGTSILVQAENGPLYDFYVWQFNKISYTLRYFDCDLTTQELEDQFNKKIEYKIQLYDSVNGQYQILQSNSIQNKIQTQFKYEIDPFTYRDTQQQYNLQVLSYVEGQESIQYQFKHSFYMIASDYFVNIIGGVKSIQNELKLNGDYADLDVLDDPIEQTLFTFDWECQNIITNSQCIDENTLLPLTFIPNSSIQTFPPYTFKDYQIYKFTFTVTKNLKSSSKSAIFSMISSSIDLDPTIEIDRKYLFQPTNIQQDLDIVLQDTPQDFLGMIDVYYNYYLAFQLMVNSKEFSINIQDHFSFFDPSITSTFQIKVSIYDKISNVPAIFILPIQFNSAPYGGTLTITPTSGTSLTDVFIISADNFIENSIEINLPSGALNQYKIFAFVYDSNGACNNYTINVDVSQYNGSDLLNQIYNQFEMARQKIKILEQLSQLNIVVTEMVNNQYLSNEQFMQLYSEILEYLYIQLDSSTDLEIEYQFQNLISLLQYKYYQINSINNQEIQENSKYLQNRIQLIENHISTYLSQHYDYSSSFQFEQQVLLRQNAVSILQQQIHVFQNFIENQQANGERPLQEAEQDLTIELFQLHLENMISLGNQLNQIQHVNQESVQLYYDQFSIQYMKLSSQKLASTLKESYLSDTLDPLKNYNLIILKFDTNYYSLSSEFHYNEQNQELQIYQIKEDISQYDIDFEGNTINFSFDLQSNSSRRILNEYKIEDLTCIQQKDNEKWESSDCTTIYNDQKQQVKCSCTQLYPTTYVYDYDKIYSENQTDKNDFEQIIHKFDKLYLQPIIYIMILLAILNIIFAKVGYKKDQIFLKILEKKKDKYQSDKYNLNLKQSDTSSNESLDFDKKIHNQMLQLKKQVFESPDNFDCNEVKSEQKNKVNNLDQDEDQRRREYLNIRSIIILDDSDDIKNPKISNNNQNKVQENQEINLQQKNKPKFLDDIDFPTTEKSYTIESQARNLKGDYFENIRTNRENKYQLEETKENKQAYHRQRFSDIKQSQDYLFSQNQLLHTRQSIDGLNIQLNFQETDYNSNEQTPNRRRLNANYIKQSKIVPFNTDEHNFQQNFGEQNNNHQNNKQVKKQKRANRQTFNLNNSNNFSNSNGSQQSENQSIINLESNRKGHQITKNQKQDQQLNKQQLTDFQNNGTKSLVTSNSSCNSNTLKSFQQQDLVALYKNDKNSGENYVPRKKKNIQFQGCLNSFWVYYNIYLSQVMKRGQQEKIQHRYKQKKYNKQDIKDYKQQ